MVGLLEIENEGETMGVMVGDLLVTNLASEGSGGVVWLASSQMAALALFSGGLYYCFSSIERENNEKVIGFHQLAAWSPIEVSGGSDILREEERERRAKEKRVNILRK